MALRLLHMSCMYLWLMWPSDFYICLAHTSDSCDPQTSTYVLHVPLTHVTLRHLRMSCRYLWLMWPSDFYMSCTYLWHMWLSDFYICLARTSDSCDPQTSTCVWGHCHSEVEVIEAVIKYLLHVCKVPLSFSSPRHLDELHISVASSICRCSII